MSYLNNKIIYPILDYDFCLKEKIDLFDFVESWKKFPELFSFFQFRAKSLNQTEYKKFYLELKNKFSIAIIINDYLDIAISEKSFGIHLGKEDFISLSKTEKSKLHQTNFILKGTSSHSIEDLQSLDLNFWDYTGFGPMNPTNSKLTENKILNLEDLSLAIEKFNIKLVPIGGIHFQNFQNYFFRNKTIPAMISGLKDEKFISNLLDFL